MGELRLWCLISGDLKPFSVSISPNKDVEQLKKLIKAEGFPPDVLAKDLVLWKLNDPIPGDDFEKIKAISQIASGEEYAQYAVSMNKPMADVSEHFKELKHKHIHLIVQRPRLGVPKRPHEQSATDLSHAKRSKQATTSPSTYASPSEYMSRQVTDDEILDDRPSRNEDVAPIALLYNGFGHFEDIVGGSTDVPGMDKVRVSDLENAVDALADASQRFYDFETNRRDAILPLLNRIFAARTGLPPPDLMAAAVGANASDGHVNGKHNAIVTVVEFKNEFAGIKSLPGPQLVSYVAHSFASVMDKFSQLFQRWRVPALGISIIGHYIQFHAIIFIRHYRIVALTPMLSCIEPTGDVRSRKMLYTAFTAASVLRSQISNDVDNLKKYLYPTPPTSTVAPVPCSQISDNIGDFLKMLSPDDLEGHRRLPNVRSIARLSTGASLEFKITERHHDMHWNRFLYIATTADHGNILVKFTRRYSVQLHEFCAEKGRAPQLFGFERLPGGWFAIAMEFVDSEPIQHAPDLATHLGQWKHEMKALMEQFHSEGLVHGDLRDANFIVSKDEGKVMVIDFDWGGKVGEVSYPTSRLHPDILGDRVLNDLMITAEDDERILEATFTKLGRIQGAAGR